MTLTPTTGRPAGGGGGAVDVTDRAGRLLGHVTVDNFPASQLVTQGTDPWLIDAGGLSNIMLTLGEQLQTLDQIASEVAKDATLATLASEDTLARVKAALDDVALTALLQREALAVAHD